MRNHSAEVSIPRLLRLLRPLRVKCQQLGVLSNRISYRALLLCSDVPPLAELPKARTRCQTKDFVELVLKVHAVCDAFRNILTAIFRDDEQLDSFTPTLAAACASVVGYGLESEIERFLKDEEILSEIAGGEMNELIEQGYEAVPWHHRRWTFISHSLSIILDLCPHYPSLLLAVYNFLVSRRLFAFGRVVLRHLLEAAVKPESLTDPDTNHSPPPICDISHETFLSDFSNGAHPIPYQTVTRVLLDAQEEHGVSHFWACKAISKLARKTSKEDFGSFVQLLTALERCTGRQTELAIQSSPGPERWSHPLVQNLQERLGRWMYLMIVRLAQNSSTENFALAISFIVHMNPALSLYSEARIEGSKAVLHSYASLTVYCLSHHHAPMDMDVFSLVNALERVCRKPTWAIFDTLLRALGEGKALYTLDTVSVCGAWLRSLDLHSMELALWEATIRRVDSRPNGESCLVEELGHWREEIQNNWSDAHRRHLAQHPATRHSPSPSTSSESSTDPEALDTEWRPAKARSRSQTLQRRDYRPTKTTVSHTATSQGHRDESISTRTVLGKRQTRPPVDWWAVDLSPHPNSVGRKYRRLSTDSAEQKENRMVLSDSRASPTVRSPRSIRSISTSSRFRSLLADSGRRRTQIHCQPAPASKDAFNWEPHLSDQIDEETATFSHESRAHIDCAQASSDDALDLLSVSKTSSHS